MPRGFAYPNFGSGGWLPPALWQPIAAFEATHKALALRGLHVDSRTIVRLRAGADSSLAAAAMRTIAQRLAIEYPSRAGALDGGRNASAAAGNVRQLSSTLWLIAGAIGLVLLLACANVANLLLIRSSVRAREMAVRAALGADASRIARFLFVEAAVLALAAGAAGVGLASVLLKFLRPYAAQRLPFATDIAVDARAVLMTVGLSAATAVLIGMLPAMSARRENLVTRLRGGAGGASDAGGIAQRRVRDTLVAIQFALAITVLIGTGLLVRSVRPRRVGAAGIRSERRGDVRGPAAARQVRSAAPRAAALYQRILAAVNAVPSVELSAAAGGALLPTKVETDEHRGAESAVEARYHPISTDFFRLRRIPIVAGRGFTDEDMRSPSRIRDHSESREAAVAEWKSARPAHHRVGDRRRRGRTSGNRSRCLSSASSPIIVNSDPRLPRRRRSFCRTRSRCGRG